MRRAAGAKSSQLLKGRTPLLCVKRNPILWFPYSRLRRQCRMFMLNRTRGVREKRLLPQVTLFFPKGRGRKSKPEFGLRKPC